MESQKTLLSIILLLINPVVYPFCISFIVDLNTPSLSIIPYLDIQGIRYLPLEEAIHVFSSCKCIYFLAVCRFLFRVA